MYLTIIFSPLAPSAEVLGLYPYSQRHLHKSSLLFILTKFDPGLPSASSPYRRFEKVIGIEISNTDSAPFGLTISNHR